MPLPILTVAQMREWESATWATGQTETAVIRQVGQKVANRALSLTTSGDLIVILAGKGNNGADAHCAREHLADRRVDLLEVKDPAAELSKLDALLSLRPKLVLDGLFGIGLHRPLDSHWCAFIERVNSAQLPVLAIDIPSGLNGDNGAPQPTAIRAMETLAVGAVKIGQISQASWEFVGRLEVADPIGLIPCPIRSELLWSLPDDFEIFPPRRPVASHKGTYGHVVIVAGSLGFHGAAVLAARGAQRAQPGLITLQTMENVYVAVASHLQAVMVAPWKPNADYHEKHTALLIGPGLAADELSSQLANETPDLWRNYPTPMIVDASALTWLPPGAVLSSSARVITPHPGEAARLLGITTEKVQGDRVKALRDLSKKFGGTWVVLKGHQTLIGRAEGDLYVNSSGNPHLAQGGSGDLLSGFLVGFLAQARFQSDPGFAIRYAVWRHGAAADSLQGCRPDWVIEDLAEAL